MRKESIMRRNSLRRLAAVTTLVPLTFCPLPARPQQTGSFSGTVVLDGGQPLSWARVSFNKIRKLRVDSLGKIRALEPLFNGSVLSGVDGRFHLDRIPEGDYILCAEGSQANQLRSCDWGQRSTAVRASGSPSLPVTLNVRTGALLTINIEDPNGLIKLQDSWIPGVNARQTNVGLGVVSDFRYFPAKLTNVTQTKWTYAVAVPIGVSAQLFVDTQLNIVDQAGGPVLKRAPSLSVVARDISGVAVNLMVK
jgi:hypothetical protein